MVELDGIVALVVLGLWIFCLLDVLTTDESVMRNLGKAMWIIIVLILPAIGSISWLVAGRPQTSSTAAMPYKGNYGPVVSDRHRPEHPSVGSPDDEEAFLRGVRQRAEEQRRAYRDQKRNESGTP